MPKSNLKEQDSGKQRLQNIIKNSHIATWFFNRCFKKFFNDVLKPHWNLENWWYCYEWQHKGSVHVHRIEKKWNAKIINWKEIKENENEMKKILEYIDSIVTTMNLRINAAISEKHLCQKASSKIDDSIQDYIKLINKLQQHMKCNPSYCIRTN